MKKEISNAMLQDILLYMQKNKLDEIVEDEIRCIVRNNKQYISNAINKEIKEGISEEMKIIAQQALAYFSKVTS